MSKKTYIMKHDLSKIVNQYKDYMTCKEMSIEFGIHESIIRKYCYDHKIVLLGIKEYRLNYIRDMAGKHSKEWIAEKLGITVHRLIELADEEGVSLLYAPPSVHSENPGRIKWSEILRQAMIKERVLELHQGKIINAIKGEYTQSGSPFGMADEVFNRNLK